MPFRNLVGVLSASFLLTLLIACSRPAVIEYQELNRLVDGGTGPRHVAVLPFVDHSHTQGLAEMVRISFYSHLSALPYRDVEIHQIDTLLEDHHLMSQRRYAEIPVTNLGPLLGADAVIFGEVIEFDRVFAGFYSQLSVGAAITVYDTRTGRKLWTDEFVSRFHEGGLPLGIIDIPLITMRSGLNLRETVKVRAVDELCRKLVARIPSPEGGVTGGTQRPGSVYAVQSGAFLEEKRAMELMQALTGLGYPAYIEQTSERGDLWHKVLLGPYQDFQEARQVRDKIREATKTEAYVCRIPRKPE